MTWNNEFHETVAFFMAECGRNVTLTIDDGTGVDDGEGGYTPNIQTIPARLIPLDYISKSDGAGTKSGTMIQTGDKQVFIQPSVSLQTINPAYTKLNMDGQVWKFIAIKNLDTTGTDCVMFEAYVRS